MKLRYYPETDSLYIELKDEPSAETHEVASNVNVDLDAKGDVIGFDIDHASERLDLSTLDERIERLLEDTRKEAATRLAAAGGSEPEIEYVTRRRSEPSDSCGHR